MIRTEPFGILAEFPDAESLVKALREAREHGFREMEVYTPFPVEEAEEILDRPNWLPLLVLCGGITGALTGWILQQYVAVWNYPINVGGRPLNSWPAFVIVTFELTILFAAGAAFFGTVILSGLPAPYHPLGNADRFAMASGDRFFLCVSAKDRKYDPEKTAAFLRSVEAENVEEVHG